jgi:hypothetical protein
LQELSIQARDGAARADLDVIISGAMAAWDPLGHTAQTASPSQ